MPRPVSQTLLGCAWVTRWFLTIVLFSAFSPTISRSAMPDILRVEEGGTITLTVARQNGLFNKYGIEIQSSTSSSSDEMRAKLADGRVDITDDGLDNAVAMVLSGADIVIVTGSATTDQELIAQPEFKTATDLRGKTIIVDATNTQNALLLKKILLKSGLKPNLDYQLKSVGTRRLPEMRAHKEYAAGMMSGTTAIVAKREGFVSVGRSSKLIGPLMYSGSYVRRQWAHDHADLLSRFIAANIEAQRWIMSPANKAKVIEIIMDSSNPKIPADVAAEAYVSMVKGPGALTNDLRFNVLAFKNFLKLRAEVEGSWGGAPPAADKFYDLSFTPPL
jgi:ABC-type nitrate/sulfonate/bicarbonate transport system substrate-binding protein